MTETFIFRVDSSPDAGLGHLSRCLALGQELSDRGYSVIFLSAPPPSHVQKVKNAGIELLNWSFTPGSREDLDHSHRAISDFSEPHLIVDGYQFGLEYLRNMTGAVRSLILVDDFIRLPFYPVDVIIDHNPGAEKRRYPLPEPTIALLGPKYLMLSKEYASVNREKSSTEKSGTVERILITMGASDIGSFTLRALRSVVEAAPETGIDVVVGPSADTSVSKEAAAKYPQACLHLSPPSLRQLAERADLAITAGGMTLWELASKSLPLVVVSVAKNQAYHSEFLASQQAIKYLGSHSDVTHDFLIGVIRELISDREGRHDMGKRAATIADGLGTKRIADTLTRLGTDRQKHQT